MSKLQENPDEWEKICTVQGFAVLRNKKDPLIWDSSAEDPDDVAMVVNYLCEEGFLKDDEDWYFLG